MHRFGQQIKRDILLPPETETDDTEGGNGTGNPNPHLQTLRRRLEAFDGVEIKDRVEKLGPETVFDMIGATKEELEAWERGNPVGFERFKVARERALRLCEGERGREMGGGGGAGGGDSGDGATFPTRRDSLLAPAAVGGGKREE